MKKQSRNNLEYLINNLSDTKIKNLIELLENKKLTIKSNDYKFLDNRIREQFIIGGTGINIHKYMGPVNQGDLKKADQPMHTTNSVTNIQDLLFLENRDRKYEKDVTFMKGVYNVNDIDFDLSQFGLFLQNTGMALDVFSNLFLMEALPQFKILTFFL